MNVLCLDGIVGLLRAMAMATTDHGPLDHGLLDVPLRPVAQRRPLNGSLGWNP
jgi:hypothetical protein